MVIQRCYEASGDHGALEDLERPSCKSIQQFLSRDLVFALRLVLQLKCECVEMSFVPI